MQPVAVRAAVWAAHYAVFGVTPSEEFLGCAVAQIGQETGWEAVWNGNIGNIMCAQWSGACFEMRAVEGRPGSEHERVSRFRAYTAEEGVIDYLHMLLTHWPTVLVFFANGDPRGAALELSKRHYYTGDPEIYANNMASIYRWYTQQAWPVLPQLTASGDPDAGARLLKLSQAIASGTDEGIDAIDNVMKSEPPVQT